MKPSAGRALHHVQMRLVTFDTSSKRVSLKLINAMHALLPVLEGAVGANYQALQN